MDTNICSNSPSKVKRKMLSGQANLETLPSCRFDKKFPTSDMSPGSSMTNARLFRIHLMKEYSQFTSCRRRLDFNTLNQSDFYDIKHEPTVSVARRNERERNRVKLINMTFATLREHLPYSSEIRKRKKISKVDTLKSAIDYIRYLKTLVGDRDQVDAVLENRGDISSCTSYSMLTSQSPHTSPTLDASVTSPSSDPTLDGLSAEEEELLDFASWF